MSNSLEIAEFPNETLLTRAQVKEILKISYAQLDSHIPDSELPRTRMNGHTFVYRSDLAAYIQAHRSSGSIRKNSVKGGEA
ncbi:helix-turn-helix domain-containing protein [Treponema sp.]|uniref:helix-turn-helix domain-containing protein n=1 Tax=Treponema sp. TaxID=166 RepID=UPI003EFE2301